jgi:hypothetical protein
MNTRVAAGRDLYRQTSEEIATKMDKADIVLEK